MENNFIKITNAAYRVLDFFPDADPLKNKTKEKVLAILENLTLIYGKDGWISLKTCLPASREKASAQLLDDIEVLESYLKLGKYQGWIDNVNFLIITKEYRIIEASLRKQFPIFNIQIPNKSKIENPNDQNLKTEEPKRPTSDADVKRLESETLQIVKSTPEEYSKRQNPLSPNTTARQGKILQILTEQGKAQVSGIIKKLPDVTKRTIRRDLDSLLKQGEIMRIGEFNQVFYTISKTLDKNTENPLNLDRTRMLS